VTLEQYYDKTKFEQLQAWQAICGAADAVDRMGFISRTEMDLVYGYLLDLEPWIEWYPEYDSYYDQYNKYEDGYYYWDWLDSEHNDICAHYERRDKARNRHYINVKCKRDAGLTSYKNKNYKFKNIGTHKGKGQYY
jgi:hypothetical protein